MDDEVDQYATERAIVDRAGADFDFARFARRQSVARHQQTAVLRSTIAASPAAAVAAVRLGLRSLIVRRTSSLRGAP